ncbi:hypothetical protein [Paraburkholderia phosphatilytica]|uniref:hypothetical protein n=1 Tax=Paraburkholderia phosphatilytica TaxID=2282883 RepID=UPI000F5D95A9|nr:hypothetical protein [Paraburkholderia phosphatilytica]
MDSAWRAPPALVFCLENKALCGLFASCAAQRDHAQTIPDLHFSTALRPFKAHFADFSFLLIERAPTHHSTQVASSQPQK